MEGLAGKEQLRHPFVPVCKGFVPGGFGVRCSQGADQHGFLVLGQCASLFRQSDSLGAVSDLRIAVGGVQQQVRKVMPGWVEPVQSAIEHVGHPRERMSVAASFFGDGPANALPRQAGQDVRIFPDVNVVVVIDKLGVQNGPVRRHCDHREQEAGKKKYAFPMHGHNGSIAEQNRP
jgi:hypothetical protein